MGDRSMRNKPRPVRPGGGFGDYQLVGMLGGSIVHHAVGLSVGLVLDEYLRAVRRNACKGSQDARASGITGPTAAGPIRCGQRGAD